MPAPARAQRPRVAPGATLAPQPALMRARGCNRWSTGRRPACHSSREFARRDAPCTRTIRSREVRPPVPCGRCGAPEPLLDHPDLVAIVDLLGEPALVLRRPVAGAPTTTILHANRRFLGLLSGEATALPDGTSARVLREALGPRPALEALLRAAAAGEEWSGTLEATSTPVVLSARGLPAPGSADLYLVCFALLPQATPAELAALLTGLSRECFYAVEIDVDCRLRLTWGRPALRRDHRLVPGRDRGQGRLCRPRRRRRPRPAPGAQHAPAGRRGRDPRAIGCAAPTAGSSSCATSRGRSGRVTTASSAARSVRSATSGRMPTRR